MAEIIQIMLYIQVATVIGCLAYSAIIDLIKREISDIPWIIMAIEGIITTIIILIFSNRSSLYTRQQVGILVAINLVIGLLMGYLLYYTGVMGGADAKALMALSINTSVYPFLIAVTQLDVYRFMPSVFNIFFNWLLTMVIIYPLPLLFYNIYLKAKGAKLFEGTTANFASKILMMISGYLIPTAKALNRTDIVYSETFDEEEEKWEIKHFMQVQEIEEEEEFKKEVEEKIKETGRKKIWVKVLPPGIVFLLIGYIINIVAGNILFLIYHFAL
ncbi:MAG: prepilin peptidase [Candidatus Heimdallarchaeota archaeon]|nr:prepilin peptidase [Candidatus Heimdallarchaeota archaeon]MCK4876097.1 prepilin peptidase [Candidatus Heimdallarchaeota archaeon]